MQLLLLHLDDALELQPEFVRSCMMAGAHEIHEKQSGRAIRLWGKDATLSALHCNLTRSRALSRGKPRLVFMGSGDFHHVSALLLSVALEDYKGPVTVIHIDNHPDWVHFSDGLHCGSWVNRALDHGQVARVITLGVCSDDLVSPERKGANLDLLRDDRLQLYPYRHAPSRVKAHYGAGASYEQKAGSLHWRCISEMGEYNFIDRLLASIETPAVYITVDKDVLARSDALTNWDQGMMQLPYVLSLISEIGARHRIIGADVTGDYSRPDYSGSLLTRALKHGEILLDQPLAAPDREETRNINSAANHALLDVLAENMQ
ncbi:arginase family protein [Rhizobium paknamense]|uniref:Arginase family enzyme n=1 Tax=Rhizobium paknamense TaxID=1206817 RepID=A0ABU0IBY7_9HYPH|nr:arginase family protein [Rhizobium paknamense]MDQ0455744.1 arginase family enzyme [Rhizobium paknamense]